MLTPFGVLRQPHIASSRKPGPGQRIGILDKQVGRRPAVRSHPEVRLHAEMNLRAIKGDETVSAAAPLAGAETKPAVVGKGSGQVTHRKDRRYSRTHDCNLSRTSPSGCRGTGRAIGSHDLDRSSGPGGRRPARQLRHGNLLVVTGSHVGNHQLPCGRSSSACKMDAPDAGPGRGIGHLPARQMAQRCRWPEPLRLRVRPGRLVTGGRLGPACISAGSPGADEEGFKALDIYVRQLDFRSSDD